jgi:hypothetical protein
MKASSRWPPSALAVIIDWMSPSTWSGLRTLLCSMRSSDLSGLPAS